MDVVQELLPGCLLLQPQVMEDLRGCFVKTYHASQCAALGVAIELREEFYSISHCGVLRGMHFQLPPHAHDKLVLCLSGRVRDVLLDLRRGPGYGRIASVELSGTNRSLIFIPKGVAHGFVACEDNSLMLYKTSAEYAPASDCGIRWNSFGFDWGLVRAPCLSERDQRHGALQDFDSPF